MAVPTRKEWRKLRDDAGGTEGESKKVSVGKALDKYHAAAAKYSGDDLMKPLQDLEKDLNAYCDAVKGTNSKLANVVETKLIAEIKQEKKEAKGVAQNADKIEDGVGEIEKLAKKNDWVDDRQKIAGLYRLIRAAADQLADVDPDNRWAQIHRMTVLAHGDIEKLDNAIGTKDQEKIDKASTQAEGTIEDTLKAIKKYVK
jgi:hypothetical protein